MRIDTHTPHVEQDWAEAFLLELRLRGVGGRRIGAALAEVEAHCAESGESGMSVESALSGYTFGFWALVIPGVLLFLIAPLIQRLMHGVR